MLSNSLIGIVSSLHPASHTGGGGGGGAGPAGELGDCRAKEEWKKHYNNENPDNTHTTLGDEGLNS